MRGDFFNTTLLLIIILRAETTRRAFSNFVGFRIHLLFVSSSREQSFTDTIYPFSFFRDDDENDENDDKDDAKENARVPGRVFSLRDMGVRVVYSERFRKSWGSVDADGAV